MRRTTEGERSSWFHYEFLQGRLIGSEHPENLHSDHAEKIAIGKRTAAHLAEERNIRGVIILTLERWTYDVPRLSEYHIPMSDRETQAPSVRDLSSALTIIDTHLSRSEGVWVHCQRGMDRTGCVIGCYLSAIGYSPERVIEGLRDRFPAYRSRPEFHGLWEPVAERIREFANPSVGSKSAMSDSEDS